MSRSPRPSDQGLRGANDREIDAARMVAADRESQ